MTGTGTAIHGSRDVVSADRRYVLINAQPQAMVLNGFTLYYSIVTVPPPRPAAPATAPAPKRAAPADTSQPAE